MSLSQDMTERIESRVNQGLLGQWYAVAKSVQVQPESTHAVKALGQRLVLWRDADGKIACLEDFCPHRGAPLSHGEVKDGLIACRYHGVRSSGRRRRADAGHAGLRARRPQGGASYEVKEAPTRSSSTSRASSARAAPTRAPDGTDQPGGPDSCAPALAGQLSLRARQPRRPDARLLSARRQLHARLRVEAGHHEARQDPGRLSHQPCRAGWRELRLVGVRGSAGHGVLLPRPALPPVGWPGWDLAHHRLRDARRRHHCVVFFWRCGSHGLARDRLAFPLSCAARGEALVRAGAGPGDAPAMPDDARAARCSTSTTSASAAFASS